MDAHELGQIAAWSALHGGGLAIALASRWSVGRSARWVLNSLLAVTLCLIAWLAAAHMTEQFQLFLFSATTLAAMVIAAVLDLPGDDADPLLAHFAAAQD